MRCLFLSALLTFSQISIIGALPSLDLRQFVEAADACSPEIVTVTVYAGGPSAPATSLAAGIAAQPASSALSDPASATEPSPYPGTGGSETYTSGITFVDPNLNSQTVTSTDLPETQTPTTTNATGSLPDTTGSIITTLETGGNPPVQPFPTSLVSVTESTIQPTNTTAPFDNATNTETQDSVTQTVTLPLSTLQTIVTNQTVATIPVETTATLTAVTVFNTTLVSGGSTIATSAAGTTVITVTGTASTETTIGVSSTLTVVNATTVTTVGSVTGLPTGSPQSSCPASMDCSGQDIFLPIAVGQPPSNIQQRSGHPVPRLGINNITGPIETNKFYANAFLGSQGSPVFVTPYSLVWSKSSGNAQSWGMAISHLDNDQKVFGPPNTGIPNQPNSYYINALGIQSMIISASQFDRTTVLTSDELLFTSANLHLSTPSSSGSLTLPVVQGMAMVTGLYDDLQPAIQSSVFFRSVASVNMSDPTVFKYRCTLEDGKIWLIYAISDNGIDPNFLLKSSTLLQAMDHWSGMIQIAKVPPNTPESIYDNAAGVYPTSGSIRGYATGANAQYSLSWNKGGPCANNATLLMYALPHHVASFSSDTNSKVTSMQLGSLTKGLATAVASDYWVLQEQLPTDMGFGPYSPSGGFPVRTLSTAAITAIQNSSGIEASQNVSAQTNLNSMYYSGKGLSKFAQLTYTMNNISAQPQLAASLLAELKGAWATFANNEQQFPLLYDTDWKGIVSSASYVTGDSGADFGNSYYNDHHFHYGYFLHAAAVIGYLDPSWIPANKDYVNALARDVSNPSSLDQYFPVFRSFDWYNGHSLAKGLFESGDGKDEESSSEDTMFAYGLKMWGQTVGDASMEARGNLMLTVLKRSLDSYFLMSSTNANQPAQFIGNKVTGILFENKADHVTYFGTNFEYIQGIHMIPIMPFSTFTRSQQFVAEEWATYFADGACDPAWNVTGGWKGILYGNLVNINPTAAYNFFTQSNFDNSWLDGGATRSWYIALAASLGGGPQ